MAAYIVVSLASLAAIFPVYWMVATSLKTRWDSFRLPPKWIFVPTFESLRFGADWRGVECLADGSAAEAQPDHLGLGHGAGVAGRLGDRLQPGASFPLTPGSKHFAGWVLSTRVLPPVVVALPIFAMMQRLGLVDTYPGLIIPYAAFNLPFVVWMLKGFFEGMPEDLEHSAMVDGATAVAGVPHDLPAAGRARDRCHRGADLDPELERIPLCPAADPFLKTAPVSVTEFVTMYGIEWGQLTATASLMALPPLILTMLVQKHLVKGLTFGAVK